MKKTLKVIAKVVAYIAVAAVICGIIAFFCTSEAVVVSETTAEITKMEIEKSSNGTNQYYIAVNDQNEDIIGVYPVNEKTYAKYSIGDLIVVQGKVDRNFLGESDIYYLIRQD